MARKDNVTKVMDGDTCETASRQNPMRLRTLGGMLHRKVQVERQTSV